MQLVIRVNFGNFVLFGECEWVQTDYHIIRSLVPEVQRQEDTMEHAQTDNQENKERPPDRTG